jgi:hypothetical protein
LSIRNRVTALTAVMATLAIAAPVAGASAAPSASRHATLAATTASTVSPSSIPCYPYPAFCGPGGKPWFPLLGLFFNLPGTVHTLGPALG